MTYVKINAALYQEAAEAKRAMFDYIQANENHMKRESTATRRAQYERGEITREKCAEYAIERAARRIEKETAAAIARAEEISEAPAVKGIEIYIKWIFRRCRKEFDPRAQIKVYTEGGTITAHGSATGGNYDKESTAIAEALNQVDAALKLIYDQRENGIKLHGTRPSHAAPEYEGGTGINCISRILEQSNIIEISREATASTDYYYFERR